MKIHNVTQGSPEWLALRAQHFTASEAAAMMGTSPYMTRNELLRLKHSGIPTDIDAATQSRFDDGHASEAAARPNVERILQEDLYPSTVTEEVEGLDLLASLDGLNMEGDLIWENKLWSQKIEAMVEAVEIADSHWPQLEQQMLVTGATRAFFTGSTVDGEIKGQLWYESKPERRKAVIAGWKQFAADLATYTPTEVIPAAVAAPIKDLPAIVVSVGGALTVETNFAQWGKELNAFIARIPPKPSTDQEFADCKAAVSALKKAEEQLDAEESRVLSLVPSIDDMKREKKLLRDLSSTTRLALEKLVAARDLSVKNEIVQAGKDALSEHIANLNIRIGRAYMPDITADWAGAIKGKKLYSAMRSAVSDLIAAKKIDASAIADRIEINLRTLREQADGYQALFPDVSSIVLKAQDDLIALMKSRIADHKAAEEKRLEAEREKIRAEEQAKAAAQSAAAQNATAPAAQAVQAPSGGQPQEPAAVAPLHSVDTGATLKLGEINARIAPLSINAEGLRALGFRPNQDGAAKVFRECDFQAICAALVRHLQAVANSSNERKAAQPSRWIDWFGVPPEPTFEGNEDMDCKAELHIADDYGDNHATMHCQLPEGHEGPHEERFERNGEVVLTRVCDEREPDPEPCRNAAHMAEHACTNRNQCWEPCGELGQSEEHAIAVIETPNVELTGAAAALLPQRPATEGSEVERRVGGQADASAT